MRSATSASKLWGFCSDTTCAGAAWRVTAARSSAALRPQRNAAWLAFTATPLISMALSSACADSGTNPFWNAKPSRNRLAAMASPMRRVASCVASMKSARPSTDSSISARTCVAGNSQSGCCAKCPVGCSKVLTSA
ncbi:hypothetical protein D9M69_657550 [compost metagenome]